jgi:hypothetical protein
MDDSSPEERIIVQVQGQPDGRRYLDIFVGVPMIFLMGLAIWWFVGFQLLLVVVCSSLLAWAVLIKELFVTPPMG